MFEFLKKKLLSAYSHSKISAAPSVEENGMTLQGEDPGTIPSDDNPNPLINEINE